MSKRFEDVALLVFAALLGLFEGPAQIACIAGLIAIAIAGGFRSYRPGLPELGIALWMAAGIPGVVIAVQHGTHLNSEATLRPLHALAFLIGARGIDRAEAPLLEKIGWCFVVAILVNAIYGYLQVAIGELPLDRFLIKNKGSLQIYIPGFTIRSASGLYYNRLKLAHVGMLAFGLLVLVLATRRPLAKRTAWQAAIAAAVIAGAIVLTYARMALAAAVIGLLVVGLILSRFRLIGTVALLALLLGGAYALNRFGPEHLLKVSEDVRIRLHMSKTAFEMFLDHPLFGVGHGLYRQAAAPSWDTVGALMDAHNFGLQVLAETGIVGFFGLSVTAVVCLSRVGRSVRRARAAGDSISVRDRFTLFGLTALFVLGATHVPTHHAPVALSLWCLLGMASAPDASSTA
jgi:O-antigen ligase